jgi:hypothetical protein
MTGANNPTGIKLTERLKAPRLRRPSEPQGSPSARFGSYTPPPGSRTPVLARQRAALCGLPALGGLGLLPLHGGWRRQGERLRRLSRLQGEELEIVGAQVAHAPLVDGFLDALQPLAWRLGASCDQKQTARLDRPMRSGAVDDADFPLWDFRLPLPQN